MVSPVAMLAALRAQNAPSDAPQLMAPSAGLRTPLRGNAQQIPLGPGMRPSQRWAKLNNGQQVVVVFDPHRYARFNGSQTYALTQNNSRIILTESNTYRNALTLRNSSAGTEVVFIEMGSPASADSALRLGEDDQIAFTDVVPQDIIYAFSTDAAARVTVASSNTPQILD